MGLESKRKRNTQRDTAARLWIRTSFPLLHFGGRFFPFQLVFVNPGGAGGLFHSSWCRETSPEGYFHVLHPGRSPTGSLDHERRAPYEWHDAGALLDAERGDTGCQHSCAKVNITNKLQVVHIPSSWVRETELLKRGRESALPQFCECFEISCFESVSARTWSLQIAQYPSRFVGCYLDVDVLKLIAHR